MGINTLIEQFKNTLIEAINDCQLPVGVAFYVAKDVFAQIEAEYQKALAIEKEVQNTEEDTKEIERSENG